MSLAAGRYDRKVEFVKRVVMRDAMGTEAESFPAMTPRLFAWASVRFGSSVERRATVERRIADGVVAGQAATFRVKATARLRAVTEADAIVWRGAHWGIQSVADAGALGHEIEFTAVRTGA